MTKRTGVLRASSPFINVIREIKKEIAQKIGRAPTDADITDLLARGLNPNEIVRAFTQNYRFRLK